MQIVHTSYTKQEIARILAASEGRKLTVSEKKLLEISDKIYLFDGLDKDAIIRICKNVGFKRYARGDVVLTQGDTGQEVCFVLNGLAAVVVEKKTVVATIEAGSMFGEMAFLTKKPRSATILAHKEGTTILSFQIDEAKCSPMFSYPFAKLYQNVALDLSRKLEKANKRK